MASISFYGGGGPYVINNLNGSGIGFYTDSFGGSTPVGEYSNVNFITNGAGTTDGGQINSCQYINSMSGAINGASPILLTQIPNYLATLNIRFEHDTAVKVQNGKLRIYDRTNINNDPSGVLAKIARIIHPSVSQTNTGSGHTTWQTPRGSAVIVDVTGSYGTSGLSPNGINTSDSRHDAYFVMSCSPSEIGSKQFAMYFSIEYL
jgi:hypothetical protein